MLYQALAYESLEGREWDAVVVGTGMGGATLGLQLARAGWRVLFLEKGRSHLAAPDALRGEFAESFFPQGKASASEHASVLARAGRWNEPLTDYSRSRAERYVPFLGCGTGGSTALFGMALERFRPGDFARWPIEYAKMLPFYEQAERLFRVHGATPPAPPAEGGGNLPALPQLHPANQALFDFLRSRGVRPYRLPMACNYERGSDRSQGFLDSTGAKLDAASVCLLPALEEFGAELLDECHVQRLEADRGRITAVHCETRGRTLRIRGGVIILAAGALATPCLLLRSASRLWPQGLANGSGLVGRNLMRHFVDLYLVPYAGGEVGAGSLKQLAFNDWDLGGEAPGQGGTVQSFGTLPPAAQLVAEWEADVCQRRGTLAGVLVRMAAPLLRGVLERKLSRSLILASIMEDSPRLENRVRPGGAGEAPMLLEYRIGAADVARIAAFRKRLQRLLAPQGVTLVKQAEENRRLAHCCGTCRAGEDPGASVVNAHGRAHELENLYLADASIFPTSGSTNPGLTIAAQALRIAEKLVAGSRPSFSQPKEMAVCG